jgi:hypothetical protein
MPQTPESPYSVFLSHSAKGKVAVRLPAERWPVAVRKHLKVWFDEWVLSVAASRQSAAFSSDHPGTRKEEGLQHSRVLAFPAVASQRRRKGGACGRDNLPFRDPLDKDRRFRARLRPLAP